VPKFSRRDFLKFAGVLAADALALSSVSAFKIDNADGPNIIILLCDALSAKHMSMYGYRRETTPNLARFAERCTVYNKHYSASNFTSSGTASMLTGMYPWKHRVLNQGGLVSPKFIPCNPYTLLGKSYYRMAFMQNFWPDRLVAQYYQDVDHFLPQTAYSMRGNTLVKSWVGKDRFLASIAFDEFLFSAQSDLPASSLLGYLYKSRVAYSIEKQNKSPEYPRGLPEVEGYEVYSNEKIYAGVLEEIKGMHQQARKPYFGYFHLFSPHSPYRPGSRFLRLYVNDGFQPLEKPINPHFAMLFAESNDDLFRRRLLYDQQVAQVDAEIGKLIDKLDAQGILDESYFIVTSDHGEMFERGYAGHGGMMMYEPVLQIPLLIHEPKQSERKDVHTLTSNIDILPTLLSIAGKEVPASVEGKVLPGFGDVENPDRSVFSMCAEENSAFLPITKSVFSMHKGNYKLISYLGYDDAKEIYEMYDLENDPDEMRDISTEKPNVFSQLKTEFLQNLALANQPFERH
jgi:arylsulfatase A-like enzyme